MDDLRNWLYVVATGLSVAAMVYAWLTARSKNNSVEIKSMRDAGQAQDRRLIKLESQVDNLLGVYTEISRIHGRIDEIAKTTENTNGQLKMLNGSVSMINKFLLGQQK